MLSINASFKSGTALTYFSWREIVSNFSAKSNYFLMSPIRQIKSLTLRAALWRFGPNTSFNPTAKKRSFLVPSLRSAAG
jgi:hypothetical protein